MNLKELVIKLLVPAGEMTEADVDYIIANKPLLEEVKHSQLFINSCYNLRLWKIAEEVPVPTREQVAKVVESAFDFLASQKVNAR